MVHLITSLAACAPITKAIKVLYPDWSQLQKSVWLVATENEAVIVRNELVESLPENTYIFVTELRDWVSTKGLSTTCEEWLDAHSHTFERKEQSIIPQQSLSI
jgi:hypothetical protein